MHIAGIFGNENASNISSIIQGILYENKKRASIMGRNAFFDMNSLTLKAYIKELSAADTDLLILNLSSKDCLGDIFDWLRLDLGVYSIGDNYDTNETEIIARLYDIVSSKGILIINDSIEYPTLTLQDQISDSKQILTYGFGSSACIAASSTGEDILYDSLIFSLQKTIMTMYGHIAEPQEYQLKTTTANFPGNDLLAAAAFAIVNEVL